MQRLTFNSFSQKPWVDKVLDADAIYTQIKSILTAAHTTLPQTPRRPDVRLIVENASGRDLSFQNPGNHSGGKPEHIPASGDARAVMIMLHGETLSEQQANAAALVARYDLGNRGIDAEFVADLEAGILSTLIAEAYGPAPFTSQSDKLKPLQWTDTEGKATTITPSRAQHAAYGAREATLETAFVAQFEIFVKGSATTPERADSGSIVIAVTHGQNGAADTTRPIAPAVAETYYGQYTDALPVARLHPDGRVQDITVQATPAAVPAKTANRTPATDKKR